jgi:hypothetical protein
LQRLTGDPFRLPENGDYPWVRADFAYAGWVPNVSGHLSCYLIDTHSKFPTFNHQDKISQPRVVAVHRSRLAQDYPFPDWAVKLVRQSALQDFVMLAESGRVRTPYFREGEFDEADDANGVLTGIVAVLPAASDRPTASLIQATLCDVDNTISQAASDRATCGIDPDRCITSEVLELLQNARDRLACFLLHFCLYRTGELRIWFDLGEFLGRDLSVDPATDKELIAAKHLAPQVYYFIKDLLHAHYHHTANSDQLLPLVATPSPQSDADHSSNELAWRYAPLRGLARVVVELRQGRSIAGHQQAKGIIAYAQAFQSLLAKITRPREVGKPNELSTKIIPYDFRNLIMSLDARDASSQSAVSARLQFFAIIVGIFLSGLALWAGAVQIQVPLCQSLGADVCPKIRPGPVVSLVNWVVANPSAFLIILVTFGIFAFVVFFRGTNAIPGVEGGIRWLRRFAEATGVQVARWSEGSDLLGWFVSLILLGGLTVIAATLAICLAPSTPVPPVQTETSRAGPWSSLNSMAGQRAEQSGLLVRSVIAQQLPTLLEDDYVPFLRAFSSETSLVRDGDLLVLTSTATVGGDGAYLVIDPKFERLEAGVRRDGELRVHRTHGASLRRPAQVIQLFGAAGRTDSGPVQPETSICNSAAGGTSGRTLHLTGFLKADEFCEYSVELQKGQALVFDPAGAKGLDVLLVNGSTPRSIGTAFIADRSGRQLVRVVWTGGKPTQAHALKARAFYVRMTIH